MPFHVQPLRYNSVRGQFSLQLHAESFLTVNDALWAYFHRTRPKTAHQTRYVCQYHERHTSHRADPKRRLFDEHKITDEDYWWIYIGAEDVNTAREVELHFLRMGMKGGSGGSDNETKFVYCFHKKPRNQRNYKYYLSINNYYKKLSNICPTSAKKRLFCPTFVRQHLISIKSYFIVFYCVSVSSG